MSSGLPINTFKQADEFRNRYLATLALEVQNQNYNLSANQVFRKTGQVSSLPDTRSTTEKLADIERLKVDLRNGFMSITDGTQANEVIEQLTPDEIAFASQQLPAIVADVKPRFAKGIPAQALIAYIRALRRKFLQTNGVSFSAQESTAQQILNALQNGQGIMGANPGPFPPVGQQPIQLPAQPAVPGRVAPPPGLNFPRGPPPANILQPPALTEEQEQQEAYQKAMETRKQKLTADAEKWIKSGTEPFNTLSKKLQEEINRINAKTGKKGGADAFLLGQFRQDDKMRQGAFQFGPASIEEWNNFPVEDGFDPYPTTEAIAVTYLKWWANQQAQVVKDAFDADWSKKSRLNGLKKALYPGVVVKLDLTQQGQLPADPFNETKTDVESQLISGVRTDITPVGVAEVFTQGIPSAQIFYERIGQKGQSAKQMRTDAERFLKENNLENKLVEVDRYGRPLTGATISVNDIDFTGRSNDPNKLDIQSTNLLSLIASIRGKGIKSTMKSLVSRANEPKSRFPVGRKILGYGLSKPKTKSKPKIDESKGLDLRPTYIRFGKYILNSNKLGSGLFDLRTINGSSIKKYPAKQLSLKLTKMLNRIVGGTIPDLYDIQDLDNEEQHFMFSLANDANINDRLKIPTPNRSKEDAEDNRFEILKGEIIAGNDNKEMVKEFKSLLLKFSNSGKINKNEAREILLDLVALGY